MHYPGRKFDLKLKKCQVFSFGKLKNYSYDFSDDINCILEDNGFGKTTFAVFIKSMFFGLNDSKKNIEENERKKYRPWNSTEKFGGNLVFEKEGKEYKIERLFGTKTQEDALSLTELFSGQKLNVDNNFARELFNIDEEGFCATVFYLKKADFSNSKLDNLIGTENTFEADKFSLAISSIEKKMKSFKSRGEKGLIADKKRELFLLKEKIEQAKTSLNSLSKTETEIEIIKKELNQLKKEIFELGRSLEQDKLDSRFSIPQDKNTLLEEKDRLEKVFNNNFPTEEELLNHKRYSEELVSVIQNRAYLEDSIKEYSAVNTKKEPSKYNKLFILKLFLLIFSGVFIIFGTAFSFFNLLAGILVLLTGAMILLVTCFIKVGFKKEIDEKSVMSVISSKQNELIKYQKIEEIYNKKLRDFISRFNLPSFNGFLSSLDFLIGSLERYNEITAFLSLKDEKTINNKNIGQSELDKKEAQFELLNEKFARLISERTYFSESADTLYDLTNKEKDLIAELNKYDREFRVLETTLNFLIKAQENLKSKFKNPLQEGLNKYYGFLADKDKKLNISSSFQLTIDESNGEKQEDFYSDGYKTLFDLCKRFAFIDVLFDKEKPFIILDDPFESLDEEKILKGIELLKNISSDYQIIYFTCHNSRKI